MNLNKSEKGLYLFNLIWSFFVRFIHGFRKNNFESILIVKLDEIGDMVNAIHVFESLKNQYPQSKITLLCKSYAKPLLENNPFIHEIITDFKSWNKKYDLVIELRGNYQSLKKSMIYMPKYRLDRGLIRFKNRGNQSHETSTNSLIIQKIVQSKNLVKYPKIDFTNINDNNVDQYLTSQSINKFVVFHTMGRNIQRRWDQEKYIQLSKWIFNTYQLKTILIGGPDEQDILQELKLKMGIQSHVFFKGNSLLDFAALVSKSNLFIGNESGPLQIACTFEIPIVALFGPGVKNVFYPYRKNQKVIHHESHNEISNPSMKLISLEEVKAEIQFLLG